MTSITASTSRPFTIRTADNESSPLAASHSKHGGARRHISVLPNATTIVISPSMTRLAVELTLPDNHVNRVTVEPLLHSIQHLMSLDCVFVALFDQGHTRIERVHAASFEYEHCNPYELRGTRQPCSAELLQRLARYRLLDINDVVKQGGTYAEFKSQMINLNLGSMLVGGITQCNKVIGMMVFGTLHTHKNWNTDMYLAMKLLSASYAAGHERCQLGLAAVAKTGREAPCK